VLRQRRVVEQRVERPFAILEFEIPLGDRAQL
jgi:hypothetical protein